MTAREALALVAFLALTYGAAWAGGIATSSSVGTWYATLDKPAWTPPGSVIGAVWSVLYGAMGVAAWLVWRKVGLQATPFALFGVQLALNVAWSVAFFGLRQPGLALVDIALLWGAILATLVAFASVAPLAGWLFAPYLAWVSFASFLNWTIWSLNR